MPKKRIVQDRGVVQVTFELPSQVKGRTVHLVGDFTSWKGIPMEKRGDGTWHTTVDLEPGRSFEFRYLIDGSRWENDWAADSYVKNPFGHENSVIETPALQDGPPGAGTEAAGATRRTAAVKKAAAKKAPAKKAVPKKTAAKKAAPKKTAAKKATTKKAASKATPKKSPPKSDGQPGGA